MCCRVGMGVTRTTVAVRVSEFSHGLRLPSAGAPSGLSLARTCSRGAYPVRTSGNRISRGCPADDSGARGAGQLDAVGVSTIGRPLEAHVA